ncbi:hypothetical protein OFC55_41240 [Escherichia coli]|nr:hypothetical protein [Escherichia coli]
MLFVCITMFAAQVHLPLLLSTLLTSHYLAMQRESLSRFIITTMSTIITIYPERQ